MLGPDADKHPDKYTPGECQIIINIVLGYEAQVGQPGCVLTPQQAMQMGQVRRKMQQVRDRAIMAPVMGQDQELVQPWTTGGPKRHQEKQKKWRSITCMYMCVQMCV